MNRFANRQSVLLRATSIACLVTASVMPVGCAPDGTVQQCNDTMSDSSDCPKKAKHAGISLPSFDCNIFKQVGRYVVPRISDPSIESAAREQIAGLEKRFEVIADQDAGDLYGEFGMICQCLEFYDAARFCYQQSETRDAANYRWPFLRGHLERLEGKTSQAKASFKQALKRIDPKSPAVLDAQLAAICWIGELELNEGEPSKAKAWFDKVLAITPNHAFAHYSLGRIAEQQEDFVTAIEHLRQASQLDPSAGSIQYILGMVYRRAGRLQEAESMLQNSVANRKPYAPYDPLLWAVESAVKSHRRYHFIADQNLKAKQYTEAIEFYERALQMQASPQLLAQTHCNLGSAYAKTGNAVAALKHWKLAASLHPEHTETLLNLAAVAGATGAPEKALPLYQTVLKKQPNHRQARQKLAETFVQLKQPANAIAEYERLLNSDTGNRDAWRALLDLYIAEKRFNKARQIAIRYEFPDVIAQLSTAALGSDPDPESDQDRL
ncbi:tetratricopeptide repeat protein [Roseiconus lacunae]|uniref:tetratricopeptide repeat protein n=1 Tax=Roseiconus lacunae TaxID=2605694 RepID=UPI001E41E3CC|nr:tetratricopeptide repeat protein [Roseiconus lacunae]MCD0458480.1 tetratricopeptide repeat protein [Roseiconus lacunae]